MCWTWERSFTEPSELVTVYSLSEVREVAGSVTISTHSVMMPTTEQKTLTMGSRAQECRRVEGSKIAGSPCARVVLARRGQRKGRGLS